ncbi:hypothetical protein [Gottfriedia solisilvae]|uniref:Uncharacterized protein n=1 Tax=Gottfriedia solisilvae TaxID=1516104 RepID=A0A8J3AKB5_9BACI|nr:hypothetical protein [Gottfriedia solisilvae]GGI15254.1 hypothetical protein GCM10007380_27050 [Gottfriedia solisilvae]
MWIIMSVVLVILFLPMFYKLNKRISILEDEVRELKGIKKIY